MLQWVKLLLSLIICRLRDKWVPGSGRDKGDNAIIREKINAIPHTEKER